MEGRGSDLEHRRKYRSKKRLFLHCHNKFLYYPGAKWNPNWNFFPLNQNQPNSWILIRTYIWNEPNTFLVQIHSSLKPCFLQRRCYQHRSNLKLSEALDNFAPSFLLSASPQGPHNLLYPHGNAELVHITLQMWPGPFPVCWGWTLSALLGGDGQYFGFKLSQDCSVNICWTPQLALAVVPLLLLV